MSHAKAERNADIVRRVLAGESTCSVARSLGISRQRVSEIFRREDARKGKGDRK